MVGGLQIKIRAFGAAEWLLSRSETEQLSWQNMPDEQDPLAKEDQLSQDRNLGGRIRRELSRTCPNQTEVERLTWPSGEMPAGVLNGSLMVRRRSTVRFRNGAPAQRDFSNNFLTANFEIK
jgi:hypothetical protein